MDNKRTCLYSRHTALGAKMSPYGGFEMPISYTTLEDEHRAVRTACGVFDVSHMGEVTVSGPDAERFVNHIFTNDIAPAAIGQCVYGMMLREDGGTVDDLIIYKMGDNDFFLVVNAANIDKDWQWLTDNAEGFDVQLHNRSDLYGQLAVQGPLAESVVEEVLGIGCKQLDFYHFTTINNEASTADIDGENGGNADTTFSTHNLPIVISRTGYTGEDGFELYGPHWLVGQWWDALIESHRCAPCGLGCRDTLRFEAGLPLYGCELTDDITPLMAGLGMFCKLDKSEFIGRNALIGQKAEGPARKIVGLQLDGKAIARHGYEVMHDGQPIGHVTTGYRTLCSDLSVCMALIDAQHAALGTKLEIQIRRKAFPATVVKKRFYDKRYKR